MWTLVPTSVEREIDLHWHKTKHTHLPLAGYADISVAYAVLPFFVTRSNSHRNPLHLRCTGMNRANACGFVVDWSARDFLAACGRIKVCVHFRASVPASGYPYPTNPFYTLTSVFNTGHRAEIAASGFLLQGGHHMAGGNSHIMLDRHTRLCQPSSKPREKNCLALIYLWANSRSRTPHLQHHEPKRLN